MMITIEKPNQVILKNADYFHLEGTLTCGQAFRWQKKDDGYFGVAGGRQLFVKRQGKDVILSGCTKEDFDSFWQNYFDLTYDYPSLIRRHEDDPWLSKGVAYAYGVRRLNQPPFETLLSFILSANNNVKRISGIVSRVSERWGTALAPGVYAFPTPAQLAGVTEAGYEAVGAGYRAKFLAGTVQAIEEGFSLETVAGLPYAKAKEQLITLPGVGPKVADCVLLYGLGFRQAFPIDVWVKRVLQAFYFPDGLPGKKQLAAFIETHFGEEAGLVQLVLFHYARNCLAMP